MREILGSLEAKTAIITGGSSGIGARIAEDMAAAGANTVIVGQSEERLASIKEVIADAGMACHTVAVDITTQAAAQSILEETLRTFQHVDIIVHAAGIWEPSPAEDASLESFDQQWAVNVRAPFALTQVAIPHLGQGSAIIFISSVAGYVGFVNSSAYCATKGAIEALTRALAIELAPRGIRVNAIAPGNIRTPMNADVLQLPGNERAMVALTPAKRIGNPDDIGPLAVFLASEEARYIVGTSVLVDGGWTAQ